MLLAFAYGAPGQAESPSANNGANPTICELHIWPTNQYAVTENMGGKNLGLVGALLDDAMRLKSPEGVTEQFKNQLSPAEQERIIREVDLVKLFHLSGYLVVIEQAENQPIWTFERMKSDERISNTQNSCYAEMAIISQQYLHQPIGTRLRTFISYKEYGTDAKPKVKVLDTTATKAPDFPADRPDRIAASTASVQSAFRENLFKFAKDKLKR